MASFFGQLLLLPFVLLLFFNDLIYKPDRYPIGSNLTISEPTGKWTSAAPLPSTRHESAAAAINGKIYVIGGIFLPSVWFPTNLVEVYDPVLDTWKKVKDYPRALHHSAATTCGDRIYVVGGNGVRIKPLSDVYAYDPDHDIWEKKADLPLARGALGLACLKGHVYAVGGSVSGKQTNQLDEYDPKTDTWTTRAPMPTAREHIAAAAVGGKIYALGGYTDSRFAAVTTNEIYDPKTDTWSPAAPLPYAVSGFPASVLGNSIFIFGGERDWNVSREVDEYKITMDRWVRRADSPILRYGSVAVTIDKTIHVIGGNSVLMGYTFSHNHDVFWP